MPHDDIPNMFGRGICLLKNLFCLYSLVLVGNAHELPVNLPIYAVLSGTKYGLKQTRGKFGLGAKMVISQI